MPYSKDKVNDAPNVDVDAGHLDESEERRLYEYYGVGDAVVLRHRPHRHDHRRRRCRSAATSTRTAPRATTRPARRPTTP